MNKEEIMFWRGIEHICPACSGAGVRAYASTATWHGGIGGQMITGGICDKCWGSGDNEAPWLNLKILSNILTKEQKAKIWELTKRGT